MVKKGENILKFENCHKQLPVPFIICADFEAITKKVQGCRQSEEMEKEKDKRSYTEGYQTHADCGCGYKVTCCYDDKYNKPIQTYQGENAVYKFIEKWLKRLNAAKLLLRKGSTDHWLWLRMMNNAEELWMGATFVVKLHWQRCAC